MDIVDDDLLIKKSTNKKVNNEIKESSYKIKIDEIMKANALKIQEKVKRLSEIKQKYNIPIKTVKEAKRDLKENEWFIANNNLYQIYPVYRNYCITGRVKENEVILRSIEDFLNYIERMNSTPPVLSTPNQNRVQQEQLSNLTRNENIKTNKGSLISKNVNTEKSEPKTKPIIETVIPSTPSVKQNNQKEEEEEDISSIEIIDDDQTIYFNYFFIFFLNFI